MPLLVFHQNLFENIDIELIFKKYDLRYRLLLTSRITLMGQFGPASERQRVSLKVSSNKVLNLV